MAEYFRRVLLSLDTDGIFYWMFRGHQWRLVQAQLLYNSTDASSFFFLFLKITIVIIIVIIIIRYYYCYYRYFIIGMYIEIFIF